MSSENEKDEPATPAKAKRARKPKPAMDATAQGAPPPIDETHSKAKQGAAPGGPTRGDTPPPEDQAGETAPIECPVIPLGREQGVYHFLTVGGEILSLNKRDMSGAGQLAALFDGHTEWLRKVFPDWGKRSREDIAAAEKDGRLAPSFRASAVRDYFMRECARAGVRDPYSDLQSTGAWRADNGDLILHMGDSILRLDADSGSERVYDPGCEIDGKIYIARSKQPKPAEKPLGDLEVAELLALLERWNWLAGRPLAARAILGWVAGAFLVGALKWRSHIWVTGGTGEGKSMFEQLIRTLLGRLAQRSSDPSEAHIRQVMKGAARPVLVDEIEPSEMSQRAAQVVETARMASTDGQAEVGRGSAGGEAVGYKIRASFYFTSILHPPLKPQDLSRLTIFDLGPVPADPARKAKGEIEAAIARWETLQPQLYRRVINAWPKIPDAVAMYDRALGKLGKRARVSDQLGTMLALAHVALGTEPLEQDWIDEYVQGLELETLIERDEAEGEAEECLTHLLTYAAEAWEGGSRKTLSAMIATILSDNPNMPDETKRSAHRSIQAYGLRIVDKLYTDAQLKEDPELKPPEKDGPWLVVAHRFDGLNKVFHGQRWAKGVWNQVMRRVPGAQRNPKRGVKMSGIVRKGYWLPVNELLDGSIWAEPRSGALSPHTPDVTGNDRDGYQGGYDQRHDNSNASDTS